MLTEQVLKQIEKDLERGKVLEEGGVSDKTSHAGGEDPPGNEPTDNDPGQGGASTDSSIKALASLDLKERDDFFKLSQIIKGLASVADKDQVAMDFLTQVGEAVRDIAGGEEGGNPKNDTRTEPGDDEPLKGHPKRQKGEPGNKASQIDVEKGLPGGEDVDLGEAKKLRGEAIYAALKKIVDEKEHAKINGVIVDLFSASAMVQVLDALNPANRKKLLSLDVPAMHKIVFTVAFKMKESLDVDLAMPVLGEMLDNLVIEAKKVQPITGRDWQELRSFADFINKDAARVAKAVASKSPNEVLDKAKVMVTNVEILIKRMISVYPSLSKAADYLDGASREMLRTMQKGEDTE